MRAGICRHDKIARAVANLAAVWGRAMPDPAYTYWYVGEFVAVMLGLWAMMFVLDWIWPSNIERERAEKAKNEKSYDATRPYKPNLP
jgi:hypothetical protein